MQYFEYLILCTNNVTVFVRFLFFLSYINLAFTIFSRRVPGKSIEKLANITQPLFYFKKNNNNNKNVF